MNVRLICLLAASVAVAGCVRTPLDSRMGTEVTAKQLAAFTPGKTTREDVIAAIGHPAQKSEHMGREIWTYPFTLVAVMTANLQESTIFEFDKQGVLVNAYKAGGALGGTNHPVGGLLGGP